MELLQFKAGAGGAAAKESQSCQYCAAISQPEKAFKYKHFRVLGIQIHFRVLRIQIQAFGLNSIQERSQSAALSDDPELGEICARKPSPIYQGATMELITQRCQVAFLIISQLGPMKDSNGWIRR